jgi:hypothetical protein
LKTLRSPVIVALAGERESSRNVPDSAELLAGVGKPLLIVDYTHPASSLPVPLNKRKALHQES